MTLSYFSGITAITFPVVIKGSPKGKTLPLINAEPSSGTSPEHKKSDYIDGAWHYISDLDEDAQNLTKDICSYHSRCFQGGIRSLLSERI